MVTRRIACVLIIAGLQKDKVDSVQKLAEACVRFTPQIAIRETEAIFLEVGRSHALFTEESLRTRITLLAKRFGLTVRVTFGSHACISFAKAYFPDFENEENFSHLPIEAVFCFLNPFYSDPEQNKKVQFLISSMKNLGIKNLEQFLKLPSSSLGSRFGALAIQIYSFATRKSEPTWRGFHPPSSIEESKSLEEDDLEGSEITLEPLLFSLKGLIDLALTRLTGLGLRASKIQIELKVAPWSTIKKPTRTWDIHLPIAQGTSLGLLPLIRERLAFELTQDPLLAPAQFLKFKILESVPGHGAQKNFFHSREEQAETHDQLLGRLLSQFGENSVFHASLQERYRPEVTWTRTLIFKDKNRKSLFFRPSRILSEPEPLIVKPSLILHPTGRFWKIHSWEGPERISTEWWQLSSTEKVVRDYYRVMTQNYERLWVFLDRSHHPAPAFLHGFFD